eukprot:s4214_g7.t1
MVEPLKDPFTEAKRNWDGLLVCHKAEYTPKDFSHFDPARASRARGIAAKAKVIALAKMGLLRQRMAKEAGTPVEGTQSTGTQCFSFRAHDKVESKPAEGTEGTQSTGTQFFSFSAGDKAAAHPRERPGSKGEEGRPEVSEHDGTVQ